MLGSLLIGAVAGLTLTPERLGWHPDARIFVMVGICGGFTTFSAFSLQVVEMIHLGNLGPAFGYVSGLCCFLGATADAAGAVSTQNTHVLPGRGRSMLLTSRFDGQDIYAVNQ